jgi:glycosyltransferase involved in cell wall biosynthesis
MNILWILEKQFDVSLDRATWLETIKVLQKKHTIRLVTGYLNNKPQFSGIRDEIVYISVSKIPVVKRFFLYLKQVKILEKYVIKYRPNALILNSLNPMIVHKAAKLAKKYSFRTYLDIRTLPVQSGLIRGVIDNYLFRKSLTIAANNFSGISYITNEMQRYCIEKYKLVKHNSSIWTSAVDSEKFKPTPPNDRKEPCLKLLYHGTIVENRGLDKVIEAFSLLPDLNINFDIVGNGNGIKFLKGVIEKHNELSRIKILPPVPYEQVPDVINDADLGILPFQPWNGWNTSSPIKLFEYLSCGRPVILTTIPAHTNVLADSDCAFWVNDVTPKSFAKAIKQAIDAKTKFYKMGKEGRELVLSKYTWKAQANTIEKFLTSSD